MKDLKLKKNRGLHGINVNYKLIIAYDGTDFSGWAKQPQKNSIADTVHNAFARSFEGEFQMVGASRTDAGVHALGQVMLLKTELDLKPHDIKAAMNNLLPESINIRSVEVAPEKFHPFYNVEYKVYWYHIFQERPLPFLARYGWHYEWPIDIEKLKQCLKVFEGTHDFRSFSSGWSRENTIRTIDAIHVTYLKRYNVYRIEVVGQKFLQHMIRRVVGACIKVAASQHMPINVLSEALAKEHPRQLLPNAPAKGLLLKKIRYIK
ncbi:MAG: tRNA pseudouridine(38-40) synthase TruA [Candidatus Babeliales bacterium]